ncbi:XRE family transcriptional regulator [Streptomyces sp. MBT65]|uniref:helix-turn-helix domain-containing protein n=1 Tax=Streptomyces sp. MBT65 TaxID=1488395 RepID=UPI001F2A67B1|nr:XRE family transcriptional regulator [Streptomyces sp. MBT65]
MSDELDPQVREFAGQLRRLVDRSGLSIAAVADRTGYSKTSWDRYLNGRLLAPKGAIVALAEVTGTSPIHLTTMWELAERAWSRSESRHDLTMEALRISQARDALGESRSSAKAQSGGKAARKGGGSLVAAPGIAGPAGVSPTVPPQPAAPDSDVAASASEVREGPPKGADSWGIAGDSGARHHGRPGRLPEVPGGPAQPAPPVPPAGAGGARRRVLMFGAGVVGALVVIGAVFLFTRHDGGGEKASAARTSASPSVSADPELPAGVKCVGAGCTGKDAEAMGCTTEAGAVTTARTATVGTTVVEVRYSKTCGAAWGRITAGVPGDSVQVSAGTAKESDSITAAGDAIAYTPMVAVKDAGEARACVTLASGRQGCTT